MIPSGDRLDIAVAIGRTITARSTDILHSQRYEDDILVDDHELVLTVTRQDATNPDLLPDSNGLIIESRDEDDNFLKLCIGSNGTTVITDVAYADSTHHDYTLPHIGQIRDLRNIIEKAYAKAQAESLSWSEGVQHAKELAQVITEYSGNKQDQTYRELINQFASILGLLMQQFEETHAIHAGLPNGEHLQNSAGLILVPNNQAYVSEEGRLGFVGSGILPIVYDSLDVRQFSCVMESGETDVQYMLCILGTYRKESGELVPVLMPQLDDDVIIKPQAN